MKDRKKVKTEENIKNVKQHTFKLERRKIDGCKYVSCKPIIKIHTSYNHLCFQESKPFRPSFCQDHLHV